MWVKFIFTIALFAIIARLNGTGIEGVNTMILGWLMINEIKKKLNDYDKELVNFLIAQLLRKLLR